MKNIVQVINELAEWCPTPTADISEEERAQGRMIFEFMKEVVEGKPENAFHAMLCSSDDSSGEEGDAEEEEDEDEVTNYSDYDYSASDDEPTTSRHITLEQMRRVVDYKAQHPKYSFKTLQTVFCFITDDKMLTRFKRIVAQNGTRADKLKAINQFV